jgi:hypothetical protein
MSLKVMSPVLSVIIIVDISEVIISEVIISEVIKSEVIISIVVVSYNYGYNDN